MKKRPIQSTPTSDHDLVIRIDLRTAELVAAVKQNKQSIGWLIIGLSMLTVWSVTGRLGVDLPDSLSGTLGAGAIGAIVQLIIRWHGQ